MNFVFRFCKINSMFSPLCPSLLIKNNNPTSKWLFDSLFNRQFDERVLKTHYHCASCHRLAWTVRVFLLNIFFQINAFPFNPEYSSRACATWRVKQPFCRASENKGSEAEWQACRNIMKRLKIAKILPHIDQPGHSYFILKAWNFLVWGRFLLICA